MTCIQLVMSCGVLSPTPEPLTTFSQTKNSIRSTTYLQRKSQSLSPQSKNGNTRQGSEVNRLLSRLFALHWLSKNVKLTM